MRIFIFRIRRIFFFLCMRSDRGTGAATEEAQVWQAVRAQLRALDSARSASLAGYEKLLKASADAKNIDALYGVVEHNVQDEQKYVCAALTHRYISGALEQLDVLMALREASASASVGDARRRKRKTDDVVDLTDTADESKSAVTRKGRLLTGKSSDDSHYARIKSQLPFARGRKVAFCQTPRENSTGEEEWIMATVLESINGDKTRYVVQDAEEDGMNGPYVYYFSRQDM